LAIGLVAVILGCGDQYLMPGQLSSFHASQTKCSACHTGAGPGKFDWLHQLVASAGPEQNSNLCISCHGMGAQTFAPHTHPVEALKQITESLRDRSPNGPIQIGGWTWRFAFPNLPTRSAFVGTVYCATCHKEHQGASDDLTTVSNERCQTCHITKFGSFADGHPQFSRYPYDRRTRIIFDHQSHIEKYLLEARQPIMSEAVPVNCADCHQLAVGQKHMRLKTFETVCSSCHNGDIVGTTRAVGPKGIDVLVVPGLDLATLAQRSVDVGEWPNNSEATLTPFMRFLLDSSGEKVVSSVASLDLLDLSKASDADLANVAALAWSIKRVFNRLESVKLETAIGEPIRSSGMKMDYLRMAALAGGMSHDVILGANREWFPNLRDDLLRHDKGEPTRTLSQPEKPLNNMRNSSPVTSDTKSAPNDAASPDVKSPDDILTPSDVAADKKGLLALDKPGDRSPDALLGNENRKGNDKNGDDVLLGNPDRSGKVDTRSDNVQTNAPASRPERFDPEVWAESGGWYRQDFAIRYRPSGHADWFMQGWLDFAGHGYGTKQEDQLAPIFEALASRDAIGQCTKCHSIDTDIGLKKVNWWPFDPARVKKSFTTFAHRPHIDATGREGCGTCHRLNPTGRNYLESYARGDPARYAPSFLYIEKARCAACHTEHTSGENCTLCHYYHVNEIADESGASRHNTKH
jgi:hypothetical protein